MERIQLETLRVIDATKAHNNNSNRKAIAFLFSYCQRRQDIGNPIPNLDQLFPEKENMIDSHRFLEQRRIVKSQVRHPIGHQDRGPDLPSSII